MHVPCGRPIEPYQAMVLDGFLIDGRGRDIPDRVALSTSVKGDFGVGPLLAGLPHDLIHNPLLPGGDPASHKGSCPQRLKHSYEPILGQVICNLSAS
jgi:hypothetical protein